MSMAQSRGHVHLVVKKLRGEVSAVWPLRGSGVGVNTQPGEEAVIAQRFEYRSVKLFGEIDFAFGSILEPKPDGVTTNVTGSSDVDHIHSNGGMGLSCFRSLPTSRS